MLVGHAPVTMFRSAEGERALTLGHVLKVPAEVQLVSLGPLR